MFGNEPPLIQQLRPCPILVFIQARCGMFLDRLKYGFGAVFFDTGGVRVMPERYRSDDLIGRSASCEVGQSGQSVHHHSLTRRVGRLVNKEVR